MTVPPAAHEAFGALRVLVIDDQEHVRKWARRVLSSLGVTLVSEAEDGQAALAVVTTPGMHFDLILCDLKMPRTDGIELIRAFSAMRLESAVVLLSMEPERVLETSALLAEEQGLRVLGAVGKPLTVEKLAPLLRSVIGGGTPSATSAKVYPREDIRDALLAGALHLLYQPKIAMSTGRIAGVEALARWKHPQFGPVGPDVFVAMCEESPSLGDWLLDFVLRESFAFSQRARESGLDLDVAINVHARAFDNIALPEKVEAVAREAGVSPDRVTLEITERSVAEDAIRMLDVATRLRLKGFNLAIDDFGTGHSGLAQLRRLPFNQLKIDRQFVHGSAESSTKRSVVEASVALARNLKMTSVAEGVQQRPEWDLLQQLGCEEMQGFFTGRPMTEEGFAAWATQWNLNAFGPGMAR
ncbi:MAG TPA: EAL domain-containing response regulator [Gemmatimonadaceae bacterium]|nr:EAL domain-containing response regulator [Gemmatimonadaceae bacterium]